MEPSRYRKNERQNLDFAKSGNENGKVAIEKMVGPAGGTPSPGGGPAVTRGSTRRLQNVKKSIGKNNVLRHRNTHVPKPYKPCRLRKVLRLLSRKHRKKT